MAQKNKFYAVRAGYNPGIYRTWDECRVQVAGYPNSVYKAFGTIDDARAYMNGERTIKTSTPSTPVNPKGVVIYADGACTGNPGPGGYGVVLLYREHRKEFSAGFRLT